MNKILQNRKIAVLAASGVMEEDMTAISRELSKSGASIRIISVDHALISCWNGSTWGVNIPVDVHLNKALGVDYDALVIPGGHLFHEKLKKTAHTKRFISSFLSLKRPIAAIGDGQTILNFVGGDIDRDHIAVLDISEISALPSHMNMGQNVAEAA
jgi:protease I